MVRVQRPSDHISALWGWFDTFGFVTAAAITSALTSRVWSSWDEDQQLQIWGLWSSDWKWAVCLPWDGREIRPSVEELYYLGVSFLTEGKMEWKTDRWTRAAFNQSVLVNRGVSHELWVEVSSAGCLTSILEIGSVARKSRRRWVQLLHR